MHKGVEQLLDVADLGSLKGQVLDILAAGDPAVMKDEPFEIGKTMVWMGLRNNGKPDILRNIRWGGKMPFPAWSFDIDDGQTLYHFVLPKPCGNLALASSERSPKAIAAEAAKKVDDTRLAEEARKAEEARRAEEARKAEAEAARLAAVKADKLDPFFEVAFGKERRVRAITPVPTVAGALKEYGYCAPLFGAKAGVDVRIAEGWRMAPSFGVAVITDTSSNSSAFAEVEINRWFGRKGFIGTGIGVWDITHSDTVAPVWLIQGGKLLWKGTPKAPGDGSELHFVVTARLFLNKMDDLSNNYQFWAGVRYIIR